MRIPKEKIPKNAKMDNGFKDKGVQLQPLNDDEYKKIVAMYKTMKESVLKFDDNTDLIIAKTPEQVKPKLADMGDGTSKWSVRVVLMDDRWASILTDEAEKMEFEAHGGCKVAIVGKIVEKPGKTKAGEDAIFLNIQKYRGCMLLDLEDPENPFEDGKEKEAAI